MSNVLLISYLFPPAAGIGSPRALSYARYLPDHGCRVFVLTAKFATTPYNDTRLLAKVPPETVVSRAFNPEVPYAFRDRIWKRVAPPRLAPDLQREASAKSGGSLWLRPAKAALRRMIERIACPDAQVGWAHFATRAAIRLIEKHDIDTVLCNIPPYSTMRIAVAVKRRYPRLKLIADIRDDWVGYYLPYFDSAATEYKRKLAVKLERELMECADYVSAVTPAQSRQIRERYPDQPSEKFLYHSNGYDPDVFRDFHSREHAGPGIVVTYFGSVYGNPVYSPKRYLDAVDGLPEELRSRVETRFIGRVAAEAAPVLAGRKSSVRQLGFMPQEQGIRYLEESDCLLLIANDPGTHAGKLFDYLATGKPILALTPPDGEIGRVIRETGTGWCVDPENPAAIHDALISLGRRLQSGTEALQPNREAIRFYSWPEIVARLAHNTSIAAAQPVCDRK
jgi:glycosyltransferase involved in cell wall biosynthesis